MTHSESTPALEPFITIRRTEHGVWTRVGLLVASGVFFALGVIAWLTPIMTGIPFYMLSLVTLGMASRRIARLVNSWEERLPHKYRVLLRRLKHRGKHERGAAPAEACGRTGAGEGAAPDEACGRAGAGGGAAPAEVCEAAAAPDDRHGDDPRGAPTAGRRETPSRPDEAHADGVEEAQPRRSQDAVRRRR